VKKRFSEEQIFGFLREAEAVVTVGQSCWHRSCPPEAVKFCRFCKPDGSAVLPRPNRPFTKQTSV